MKKKFSSTSLRLRHHGEEELELSFGEKWLGQEEEEEV
jgi:hypothetical protein